MELISGSILRVHKESFMNETSLWHRERGEVNLKQQKQNRRLSKRKIIDCGVGERNSEAEKCN